MNQLERREKILEQMSLRVHLSLQIESLTTSICSKETSLVGVSVDSDRSIELALDLFYFVVYGV